MHRSIALFRRTSSKKLTIARILLDQAKMNSTMNHQNETHLSQNSAYFRLKRVLKRYAKSHLEDVDSNGNTALLLAAFDGSPECVTELLRAGANFKQVNVFGQNALSLAAHSGCLECVLVLLTKWSYKDYTKSAALMPPLCVAAFRGHLEVVKIFAIMYPFPRLITTQHGVNALMLAMAAGHKSVQSFLRKNHPVLWEAETQYGQSAVKMCNDFPSPADLLYGV